MKKTTRNLFTVFIIFNSIFITNLTGQTRMNFVKGEELNTISFIEKGSLFTFTSDDVWLNNNLLNKRGAIRFTKKYMVYPCTLKTSDAEMEIDVYLSLGNSNYDCIIDWGGNVLEKFQLIEIDIDDYNKNVEKENQKKKSQILSKLREIQYFSEIDTLEISKLNSRKIELSKLLNSYFTNYKHLFVSDPTEISQISKELNRISAGIEKINSVERERKKLLDSMRIFSMRVVLTHNTEKIDTIEVIKRGVAVLLNVLLPDSLSRINDKLDSIYLIQCKNVVNEIAILKTVEIYEGQFLSICQLDFPISSIFALPHKNGLIYSSKNIKSDFIYQQRKLELYQVQELNAICEIIGYVRNAMKFSISYENLKSTLKKGEVDWNAKYDFDIVYNSNFDYLKDHLKNFVGYFNYEKFEKHSKLNNSSKYKLILDNGKDTITFLNRQSISLLKGFAYDLDEKYPSNWQFKFVNNSYFYGIFPCFGECLNETNEYSKYSKGNVTLWKNNQYNKVQYFPFLGNVFDTHVTDFSRIWIEEKDDVFKFNLPQSLQTIRKYFLSLSFEDEFLENYTEAPEIQFFNRMEYANGGFERKIYSYGQFLKSNVEQVYSFDRNYPFYSMPSALRNYYSTAINPSIFFVGNFKYENYYGCNEAYTVFVPPLDPFFDTASRQFIFLSGGGKNGKKPFSVYLKPTAFNIQVAPITLFWNTSSSEVMSATYPKKNTLISYKNWDWDKGEDHLHWFDGSKHSIEYTHTIQWLNYLGVISNIRNDNLKVFYGFSVNKIVN